eukprot:35985-Eustigmatos_ZCMA.PRE.1
MMLRVPHMSHRSAASSREHTDYTYYSLDTTPYFREMSIEQDMSTHHTVPCSMAQVSVEVQKP